MRPPWAAKASRDYMRLYMRDRRADIPRRTRASWSAYSRRYRERITSAALQNSIPQQSSNTGSSESAGNVTQQENTRDSVQSATNSTQSEIGNNVIHQPAGTMSSSSIDSPVSNGAHDSLPGTAENRQTDKEARLPISTVLSATEVDDVYSRSNRSSSQSALSLDASSESLDAEETAGYSTDYDFNTSQLLNRPIYPGARHTYGTCACALHEIRRAGHLTRRTMQLVMNCLQELLPSTAVFPSSVFKLDKVLRGNAPCRTAQVCN
jgi:hypothetical protein